MTKWDREIAMVLAGLAVLYIIGMLIRALSLNYTPWIAFGYAVLGTVVGALFVWATFGIRRYR
jgi:hypothetical protein